MVDILGRAHLLLGDGGGRGHCHLAVMISTLLYTVILTSAALVSFTFLLLSLAFLLFLFLFLVLLLVVLGYFMLFAR